MKAHQVDVNRSIRKEKYNQDEESQGSIKSASLYSSYKGKDYDLRLKFLRRYLYLLFLLIPAVFAFIHIIIFHNSLHSLYGHNHYQYNQEENRLSFHSVKNMTIKNVAEEDDEVMKISSKEKLVGEIDLRKCISPEKQQSWAFGNCTNKNSTISSRTSQRTCGICNQNPLTHYIQKLSERMKKIKKETCSRIVVYSVAFGKQFFDQYQFERPLVVKKALKLHHRCFFIFILSSDVKGKRISNDPDEFMTTSDDDLDVLVPVPITILPYQNMRRNTKIFKMLGYLIFPWAETIVWQDAKFRLKYKYPTYRPNNYFQLFETTLERNSVCALYLGLPADIPTVGSKESSIRHDGFQRHCNLLANSKRKDVSDSQKGILQQCSYYNEKLNNETQGLATQMLSSGMVDSGFFLRDMRSERCRRFNAQLSCSWLDEIHCFSDRDQVSFPYVLASMGIHENNAHVDPQLQNRIFVDSNKLPMVQVVKSSCHHYYENSIEKCNFDVQIKHEYHNNTNAEILGTAFDSKPR